MLSNPNSSIGTREPVHTQTVVLESTCVIYTGVSGRTCGEGVATQLTTSLLEQGEVFTKTNHDIPA